MATIAGLFNSAEDVARVLRELRLPALGICMEDIWVAGRRLEGLETYQREKRLRHERARQTDSVLLVIRSDKADLVALREQLIAMGMQPVETQGDEPRGYSQYPYGDGVRPDLEDHTSK